MEMRETLLGYAASVLDRALTGLGDGEIASLRGLLHRIKANVDA
jgi:hypothetical protein